MLCGVSAEKFLQKATWHKTRCHESQSSTKLLQNVCASVQPLRVLRPATDRCHPLATIKMATTPLLALLVSLGCALASEPCVQTESCNPPPPPVMNGSIDCEHFWIPTEALIFFLLPAF